MYYMGTWSLRVPGVIGCQACAERGSKAAGSKASEGAASPILFRALGRRHDDQAAKPKTLNPEP